MGSDGVWWAWQDIVEWWWSGDGVSGNVRATWVKVGVIERGNLGQRCIVEYGTVGICLAIHHLVITGIFVLVIIRLAYLSWSLVRYISSYVGCIKYRELMFSTPAHLQ